ncbi:Mbov_0396 family ICE element transmembrane protein [Mycoplasma feriruminatoris]|uniref:Peripheral subunit-binding (PSBD) domain-containing protein n=1 Tax=Mycoplasma feriruminatoris TaxID=1179777 RepID=A0AAX3TF86_9MOLU|nr:E3 binding domain-containing protein [Mycoplasma feriruminatoris]WFQ92787.1 hypothetical protein MFERI14822_00577 [Mycoplasma feriruminatoris]
MGIFQGIKNAISYVEKIFKLLKNLHALPFWVLLFGLISIAAGLATMVDFLGRDLVRILIFGGDSFDIKKIPQAFWTILYVVGTIGAISFFVFLIIVLLRSDFRKQIKQSLKGILFATVFITVMPLGFFILQYLIVLGFDLIKVALGFGNKTSAKTIVSIILNTGSLNNDVDPNTIATALGSSDPLKWIDLIDNINPIIPIIATVFVGWTYIQIAVVILMKSMELFTLFVSAPIYAVVGVFDNQKRLKKYIREKMIGKSFSVLGLMFVWNVSFLFLDLFSTRIVDSLTASISSSKKFTEAFEQVAFSRMKSLLNLTGLVAASFFISKGANLLGDLTRESINIAGAAPLVKTIAKVGTIAATAGAGKFGLLGKSALKKSGSGASDSNNLTSTSSDQIPATISDKVDKSNNLNSNNSTYLSGNSTISGLNNPPNSSTSSLDSSNDIVKISNLKTPPKSYRQTEVLAKDNNVDLSTITGLKKDGRVLKSDVQNAINDQKSLNTLNAAGSNNILDTATKVDKLLNDKNNDQSLLKNKSTKDDLIKQKDSEQVKKDQSQDKKLEDVNNQQKSVVDKLKDFKKEYDKISQIKDQKLMVKELNNLKTAIQQLTNELKNPK